MFSSPWTECIPYKDEGKSHFVVRVDSNLPDLTLWEISSDVPYPQISTLPIASRKVKWFQVREDNTGKIKYFDNQIREPFNLGRQAGDAHSTNPTAAKILVET